MMPLRLNIASHVTLYRVTFGLTYSTQRWSAYIAENLLKLNYTSTAIHAYNTDKTLTFLRGACDRVLEPFPIKHFKHASKVQCM